MNPQRRLDDSGVAHSLPRRQRLIKEETAFVNPPMLRFLQIKVSWLNVMGRLFAWAYAAFYFLGGTLWDKLRGRDDEGRRAARLRRTFERMGGTFIKFGQQLSSRVDLLPYAYCRALSALLDRMPPFPFEHAVEAVERVTGKKLAEVFEAFDPEPIGSASIACVYQARLRDGQAVAVKIRRPGIGTLFTADLNAIDLLGRFLELLTILRPRLTSDLRQGIREALLEELDFTREARYQDLFRRRIKKNKERFLAAPRVFFDLSGEDVLVMELVTTGLTLTEVLAAVEQNDERVLAVMDELNIKPRRVARLLLRANYGALFSDLFFHSDPHPANIFVQADSKLVFLDFGACGSFTAKQRRAIREINDYQYRDDPEGMARATLTLMEPLAPIDVDGFLRELEELYRLSLYAVRSKHSQWWERTTAVQWLLFTKAAFAYQVAVPFFMIRMIRASLLYDTLAARLDNTIDFYKEFRRYQRLAGRRARKRLRKRVRRSLDKGLEERYYVRVEETLVAADRMLYRLQQFLDRPPRQFSYTINKGAYAVTMLVQGGLRLITLTVFLILAVSAVTWIRTFPTLPDVSRITQSVLANTFYLGFVVLAVLIAVRRLLFRFADKDI